jgi:hypothetical protein
LDRQGGRDGQRPGRGVEPMHPRSRPGGAVVVARRYLNLHSSARLSRDVARAGHARRPERRASWLSRANPRRDRPMPAGNGGSRVDRGEIYAHARRPLRARTGLRGDGGRTSNLTRRTGTSPTEVDRSLAGWPAPESGPQPFDAVAVWRPALRRVSGREVDERAADVVHAAQARARRARGLTCVVGGLDGPQDGDQRADSVGVRAPTRGLRATTDPLKSSSNVVDRGSG